MSAHENETDHPTVPSAHQHISTSTHQRRCQPKTRPTYRTYIEHARHECRKQPRTRAYLFGSQALSPSPGTITLTIPTNSPRPRTEAKYPSGSLHSSTLGRNVGTHGQDTAPHAVDTGGTSSSPMVQFSAQHHPTAPGRSHTVTKVHRPPIRRRSKPTY